MVEKTLLPSTIELTSDNVPVVHSIVSYYTKVNNFGFIVIEFEQAVEITDRLFQISPKSLDEDDFEYVLSDMGIKRQ